MTDDQPVVVLRIAPPFSVLRTTRLKHLERVIGSVPIVGNLSAREPDVIFEEAINIQADIIVLDSPGTIGPATARRANELDIAIVIAANSELGHDQNGRESITFCGYARYGTAGELETLDDNALKDEIEMRRRRRRK